MLALPEWPAPDTAAGQNFFANAKEIFYAYKIRGKANPFALGMLAQAEAESSLDPNAIGDRDSAFGLHQRHRDRLAAIKAGPGIDIMAAVLAKRNTIKDEIDATLWELDTFPWLGKAAIEAAATAYGAAYQACAMFERAGAADAAGRRGLLAERWVAWFAEELPLVWDF